MGAVIYFVTPIDAIADFIPVLGWMDDAAVFTLVINQIRAELDRYKERKR